MNEKQSTLFPNTPNTSAVLNVLQDLDRAEVEPLAFKILQVIEPYCTQVQIAGSFRRRKDTINDLDIVLQPSGPLCWVEILKAIRYEFDASTVKQGDMLSTLNVPFASKQGQGCVQVDLYRADPLTWGVLLLIRTGSKEHNVKLCSRARSIGLMLSAARGVMKGNNVIASRMEGEIFTALGMEYVAPQDREVP
jgi:DNA polymerase (family 10)